AALSPLEAVALALMSGCSVAMDDLGEEGVGLTKEELTPTGDRETGKRRGEMRLVCESGSSGGG
ncbi:920_t:CDS:2, partial [Acaulospora colombiana]